jgi:hypothetical protein
MGQLSSEGTMVAQAIHEPFPNWRLRFNGHCKSGKWLLGQMEVGLTGAPMDVLISSFSLFLPHHRVRWITHARTAASASKHITSTRTGNAAHCMSIPSQLTPFSDFFLFIF